MNLKMKKPGILVFFNRSLAEAYIFLAKWLNENRKNPESKHFGILTLILVGKYSSGKIRCTD